MADADIQAEPIRVGPHVGGRKLQIWIVALLMIGEGVAIYVLANALGGLPTTAAAADGTSRRDQTGGVGGEELVEVELVECRPGNRMSGKLVTFHIRVSVLVAAADKERLEELAKARRGRLLDRVHFVFRSADPKHLNEPGLDTVKRRLKHEFDRIFADEGLIKEVLIPQRLQSGSGV